MIHRYYLKRVSRNSRGEWMWTHIDGPLPNTIFCHTENVAIILFIKEFESSLFLVGNACSISSSQNHPTPQSQVATTFFSLQVFIFYIFLSFNKDLLFSLVFLLLRKHGHVNETMRKMIFFFLENKNEWIKQKSKHMKHANNAKLTICGLATHLKLSVIKKL